MYLIENSQIGIKKTLPQEIDLRLEMEKEGKNSNFIIPYNKNRHLEVIENMDEGHLTVW